MLLSGSVPAQSGTSSVRGTVFDAEGKVIPGAVVTLTSIETGSARTQNTRDNGTYAFDLIPPGTYRVEAEAQGFKKTVANEVRALVDKATDLNLELQVGSISEAVTVAAGAGEALVNTQDASIGNNFVSEQITQLPLESRNVIQLLSLQPGVTPGGYVTGSRSDQANITLDGVDVNEQQTGLDPLTDEAFTSVLRVTPDSVEEFRVITSNPNASQGRSSGAQVSLITKAGTNSFSGSLYWSHRNTVTSANDFFNNRSGIDTPKLLRNLFGGSLGGPIKQDRAFFFYNYEGRRDSSEQTVVRTVPLASLGRGEVRYVDTTGRIKTLSPNDLNGLFPDVGVNPLAIAAIADAARRYPANDFTVGDSSRELQLNTAGFRFNAKTPLRWNTHIARLDYKPTDQGNHLFFFRGNYQQDLIGGEPQFPDTPAPDFWNHPWGIAAGHTWTISNTLINSFRYGFTREAFTSGGDSAENSVSFRFVFSPRRFVRELSRITPVHNFTNDVSWLKGDHNWQFGTNIRVIRNRRTTFANAFDNAIANPSFYDESGAVLSAPITDIADGFDSPVKNAVSAVIGRFSEYSGNFNFGADGSLLPVGSGVGRNFATEEYDVYAQDVWKIRQNLTLTAGLRYGLSRPVYEATGLQVKPTVSLGDFFERRVEGAKNGNPVNDIITVDLAGPKNGRSGYYDWDKNNFQPRISLAWSPDFREGFLGKLFGAQGRSVLRGGFAITNDYIGQQLAVQFDLNSTLGFSSTTTIAANTYNVTDRPAPRFTGFAQDVRSLPGITVPSRLTFPLVTPADEAQRIESSLDDTIVSPINYSWNVSFGRELPGELFVEASYIGRSARNLLVTRDIMHLNNLVDPDSGMDWYTAAGMLNEFRERNTPLTGVPRIAYFENLFPGFRRQVGNTLLTPTQTVYRLVAREEVEGRNILDWTFVQLLLDDEGVRPNLFFHPQYAALAAFSTIGESDYHAGTLTIRQRIRNSLSWDFNYTWSKSLDNASGLQSSDAYGGAFILNPLDLRQSRAESDFDIRQIINANALWDLPIGRGRSFLSDTSGIVDGILGGWKLGGIFRWNTGLPVQTPFDAAQWATNWNAQSNGVRRAPIKSSPTRGGASDPNLFEDPQAAYNSFRNARAGEVGDRNVIRLPGFVTLDMNLSKSFKMPFNENHKLTFRWEVFNVTNTQRLTVDNITRDSLGLDIDPHLGTPAPAFGKLDAIQGTPRVMQFGFRYTF
jgi:hypothetical protein